MADVKVYSTQTCPHCVDAKAYLDSKNIPYTNMDVGTDAVARKELMAMGHMGVPVILIDGQEIVGFNKPEVDRLLGL